MWEIIQNQCCQSRPSCFLLSPSPPPPAPSEAAALSSSFSIQVQESGWKTTGHHNPARSVFPCQHVPLAPLKPCCCFVYFALFHIPFSEGEAGVVLQLTAAKREVLLFACSSLSQALPLLFLSHVWCPSGLSLVQLVKPAGKLSLFLVTLAILPGNLPSPAQGWISELVQGKGVKMREDKGRQETSIQHWCATNMFKVVRCNFYPKIHYYPEWNLKRANVKPSVKQPCASLLSMHWTSLHK